MSNPSPQEVLVSALAELRDARESLDSAFCARNANPGRSDLIARVNALVERRDAALAAKESAQRVYDEARKTDAHRR